MLRKLLLGFGLVIAAGGAVALVSGLPQGLASLCFGVLIVLGTLFERWRYKPAKAATAARGEHTGERFLDPETGALMEVYYDAASGERSYVRVQDTAPPA